MISFLTVNPETSPDPFASILFFFIQQTSQPNSEILYTSVSTTKIKNWT